MLPSLSVEVYMFCNSNSSMNASGENFISFFAQHQKINTLLLACTVIHDGCMLMNFKVQHFLILLRSVDFGLSSFAVMFIVGHSTSVSLSFARVAQRVAVSCFFFSFCEKRKHMMRMNDRERRELTTHIFRVCISTCLCRKGCH